MALAPLVHILDPRPLCEDVERPIADSVCIPAPQLVQRLAELPPKSVILAIADVTGAEEAARTLEAGGRRCVLVAPVWASRHGVARLWSPNAWLESVLETCCPLHPPQPLPGIAGEGLPTALDLGCGQGRDAAYLSALGWDVTAVDHLPEALESAKAMTERYGDATRAQFLRRDWREVAGGFDLVLCLFLHDQGAIRQAASLVAQGGTLLVEGYNATRAARVGHPKVPLDAWIFAFLREGGFELTICETLDTIRISARRWRTRR